MTRAYLPSPRPPRARHLSEDEVEKIRRLRESGLTWPTIGERFGQHHVTLRTKYGRTLRERGQISGD